MISGPDLATRLARLDGKYRPTWQPRAAGLLWSDGRPQRAAAQTADPAARLPAGGALRPAPAAPRPAEEAPGVGGAVEPGRGGAGAAVEPGPGSGAPGAADGAR